MGASFDEKARFLLMFLKNMMQQFHKEKYPTYWDGIVLGLWKGKPFHYQGDGHVLLVGPMKSGKTANTFIPTALTWRGSMFIHDPKGEIWAASSAYRRKELPQKIVKFQPLCTDGTSARWNPLEEVRIRTPQEWDDAMMVATALMDSALDEKSTADPFWNRHAAKLVAGVILHLRYKHWKADEEIPTLADVAEFLGQQDLDEMCHSMMHSAHISKKEFLEEPRLGKDGLPIVDKNGRSKCVRNPLKEIYGEYVKDFYPFSEEIGIQVNSLEELRFALLALHEAGEEVTFFDQEDSMETEIGWDDDDDDDDSAPWMSLLTHPKVREVASDLMNAADMTLECIVMTAKTALDVYLDPVVRKNTATSDFSVCNLYDELPMTTSLYLVTGTTNIDKGKMVARMCINMVLGKLTEAAFSKDASKQKKEMRLNDVALFDEDADMDRVLVMLDDVQKAGYLKSLETVLQQGSNPLYSLCMSCQSAKQLQKMYASVSVAEACHAVVWFKQNMETDAPGRASQGANQQRQEITADKVLVAISDDDTKLCKKLLYFKEAELAERASFGALKESDRQQGLQTLKEYEYEQGLEDRAEDENTNGLTEARKKDILDEVQRMVAPNIPEKMEQKRDFSKMRMAYLQQRFVRRRLDEEAVLEETPSEKPEKTEA